MRRLIFWLIHFFYPTIEIKGADKLPASGGFIIVSNHPNGIIDPVPLMIKLEHPISFLAKSTLWGIPLINSFLNLFKAIPIYRHVDKGKWFGPKGDVTKLNERSFKQAGEHLRTGGILALFPEGTTHSKPQLLPLKTGAARIALLNEADSHWAGKVPIVPIGLWYEHKSRFRSSVLLVVGDPFSLEGYQAQYERDERETVRLLTTQLDQSLDKVILQAESQEILRALPIVAKWLNRGQTNLASQHTQMQSILNAYAKIKQHDPQRLSQIIQQMRQYDLSAKSLGIPNPWQPEQPPISTWQIIMRLLGLLLITPLAGLGLLITYLPYRLTGWVAKKAILGDDTQLSLAKIVGGVLFFMVTWGTLSILVFNRWGASYGLGLFGVIPLLAFCTLFWFETLQTVSRQLTHTKWLGARAEVRQYLNAEQDQLAQFITEVVKEYA